MSSIDWSIPNDDLSSAMQLSVSSASGNKQAADNPMDESLSTLSNEVQNTLGAPNFVDRLCSLGKNGGSGRWFPFVYEVIIFQWVAILHEQRASDPGAEAIANLLSTNRDPSGTLTEAASKTGGVVIACAPILFEVIKQSLGGRILSIHRQKMEFLTNRKRKSRSRVFPPLLLLDEALVASLEQLVAAITDACLDTRNFDSWETRQTAIDVNDSVVLFLRDLFGYLDPQTVVRLIVTYMNRFRKAAANKGSDRDSNIGLRCSWEISKLQMDAVSLFVRFSEFTKVNSPQMNNWNGNLTNMSPFAALSFFDKALAKYSSYSLQPPYDGASPNPFKSQVLPHWLSEIVTDICLAGVEHAEQNIQQRASSLLHELFWYLSQNSISSGGSMIVASMLLSFLEKIMVRTMYLSSFAPKSQTRQDLIPCVVFILQSAPVGLLRALWRRLCGRAAGKGKEEKYGGVGYPIFSDSSDEIITQEGIRRKSRTASEFKVEADILELFGLLNLSLKTLEYEGSDDQLNTEFIDVNDSPGPTWRKEYLLAQEYDTADVARRRRLMSTFSREAKAESDTHDSEYTTSSSRKWHAHDGSIVVINTAQQIVRELKFILETSEQGETFLNPSTRRKLRQKSAERPQQGPSADKVDQSGTFRFTYEDTVIFVRAVTSVYLNSLTLRQSDIAVIKTFKGSVEVVKIFGIKIFNDAVGETLQHWMRVILFHCGSRRAEVRVAASDFLELILRSTWETFGSFFRIRLPLLAVQTEVMERIVATAAAKHYRDQKRLGSKQDVFSNGSAEASLAPLWRTLDRLHHLSASQNVAFKSALVRLAEKLKKLFRAYIAAHALSFLKRSKNPGFDDALDEESRNLEAETLVRATRISVHRVINASAGYSKQFLGFYSTSIEQNAVAHHEAVEDAFIDAADVFSPTELPDHRVTWLRKLAEFHCSRQKYAEEATCHFHIHLTLQKAAGLHGALWSSAPFLPWAESALDGLHLDGEDPFGSPEDSASDANEMPDISSGIHMEKSNTFRRIFFRVANSMRVNGTGWDSGMSKSLFYGMTFAYEYNTVTPWTTLREIEATMLEEAEAAGELFLRSGIIESSRYALSLATKYYAEKFKYGKLAHVYERLAQTVVSQVPPIDTGSHTEVCLAVPLGRFYRVWFHGGAPDELIGAEFVYRTAPDVKLDQFGEELRAVIRCIVPDKTPIHLVLDGRAEEQKQPSYGGIRAMGGTPLEPVRIKVTPLRPLIGRANRIRGLPEWFNAYVDSAFTGPVTRSSQITGVHNTNRFGSGQRHPNVQRREHARSFSASVFSSGSSSTSGLAARRTGVTGSNENSRSQVAASGEGDLIVVDKFSFLQPINKDRSRPGRDWLKGGGSGDFAEKTLRVTQLQVGQSFPACVARQAVVHRVVFTQSPLEAGIDNACHWCSVLFRTAIATNGIALLGK